MGVYTSTASALNVRSGAGTGYRVVRTYPKGTRFDLYEVKGRLGSHAKRLDMLAVHHIWWRQGGCARIEQRRGDVSVQDHREHPHGRWNLLQGRQASTRLALRSGISRVVTAGGYRWGVYTAYSGYTRYVALGVVGGKSYAS